MPDLDSLNLTEEGLPVVDWDAPEAGKIPPPVTPGDYTYRFALAENPEEWFDAVERETVKGNKDSKRKFLELTFLPFVIANHLDQPIAYENGEAIQLGPQRVNNFQSQKMQIHSLAELIRAMGVRIDKPLLQKEENGKMVIYNVVSQLNGNGIFKAGLIWRAHFQATGVNISTHPRKSQGELPWPKKVDGSWEEMCKDPSTGEKAYGYAEVRRYKLPTS